MKSLERNRLEWVLLATGLLFLFSAPFNQSMYASGYTSRLAQAAWLLACVVVFVFARRYRIITFFFLLLIWAGLLFSTYMTSFGIEKVLNDPEYASILGNEESDFGSTPWFLFGVISFLATTFASSLLTFGKHNGPQDAPATITETQSPVGP